MVTPALRFAPEVLLAAQDVRVVFFGVDGVLTDGGIYFTEQGETLQRLNHLDDHGLRLLLQTGITPVVIAKPNSKPLRSHLTALCFEHVHCGVEDKLLAAEQSLAALGLDWTQAAAIGYDWPDMPVLTRCAFAVAPVNAHIETCAMAQYVTAACGGHGAVRELCDLLLTAKGLYANALVTSLRGSHA